MAQASLSTGSRSHLLHASHDDGQEVRVSRSTGMCENDPTYIPVGKKNPPFGGLKTLFSVGGDCVHCAMTKIFSEMGLDLP